MYTYEQWQIEFYGYLYEMLDNDTSYYTSIRSRGSGYRYKPTKEERFMDLQHSAKHSRLVTLLREHEEKRPRPCSQEKHAL